MPHQVFYILKVSSKSYHKRRLSACRKKSEGPNDDEGCQTRVDRSWSREETELDQEQGQEGQKLGRAGAGKK